MSNTRQIYFGNISYFYEVNICKIYSYYTTFCENIFRIFWHMGDSPERDLCDVLVSFFNLKHFELLKMTECSMGPQLIEEETV